MILREEEMKINLKLGYWFKVLNWGKLNIEFIDFWVCWVFCFIFLVLMLKVINGDDEDD